MFDYRCTRRECRARRSLKRKIEQYIRKPKCPCCGGRLSYDPAVRRRTKRTTCRCDGAHYPHRRGSIVFCKHHPVGTTDEDWEAMYKRGY